MADLTAHPPVPHPAVVARKAIIAFRTHRDYEKLAMTILEHAPRRHMPLVFGYAVHYFGNDQEEGALLVAMERVMDKVSQDVANTIPGSQFVIPPQLPAPRAP
jgi:hypothetical protein